MSQATLDIANQSRTNFRIAVNAALQALASQNSGSTAPSELYPFMTWSDTSSNKLKMRDSTNASWIEVGDLDEANLGLLQKSGGSMSGVLQMDAGADIASGASVDLGNATGNDITITHSSGTTAITSFGGATSIQKGTRIRCRASISGGSLSMTYNATSMKIPGLSNLTLVDGMSFDAVKISDSNAYWAIENVSKPDGTAVTTTGILSFRNRIRNGDFRVNQTGLTYTSTSLRPNSDDAYTLDGWYILSDGNDTIDVSQDTTTIPSNGYAAIALDVETTNRKFGIAQIIEARDCIDLIGNTITLSFKAKVSALTNLDNIKCAIVAWSGAADSVTSDIVSAWNVEGTNPTLIANATYENAPANLNLTTSYAEYSVTANIDTASTKNIIVFIWSDVTTTSVGEFLYITEVQLEKGSAATPFERKTYDVELAWAQRFLPVYNATGETNSPVGMGSYWTTTVGQIVFNHKRDTRVPTTGVLVSAASHFNFNNSTNRAGNAITFTSGGKFATQLNCEIAGAAVTAGTSVLMYAASASGLLIVTGAEL